MPHSARIVVGLGAAVCFCSPIGVLPEVAGGCQSLVDLPVLRIGDGEMIAALVPVGLGVPRRTLPCFAVVCETLIPDVVGS